MEIKDELTVRIERYVGNYFLYKIVQFQFYIRIILMRLSKIRKKEGERRSFFVRDNSTVLYIRYK